MSLGLLTVFFWVVFGIFCAPFLPCIVAIICYCCNSYTDRERDEDQPLVEDSTKYRGNGATSRVRESKFHNCIRRISEKFCPSPTERELNEERLKQLEERYVMCFPQHTETNDLNEKRKTLSQEEIKKAYKCILTLLLESMFKYKMSRLLEVPEKGVGQGTNHKEQYKVYGLLLSACIKNGSVHHGSPDDVKQKIRQYQFLQRCDEFKIDTSVNKALSMTWSMLTLLPPLLVTKPQCEYSEDILDTNRHTWDEDKSGPPLYYYRPVLVYGNRLHVAVKGLVGNLLCRNEE